MFPFVVMDMVSHAAECRVKGCKVPRCRQICSLLLHGTRCQVRVPGGCVLCKKMWIILYYHSLVCKKDVCHVPRCSDLKEDTRKKSQDEVQSRAVPAA